MKQTEIIAQLRSLRESQADFARANGDEIFKRDVEALDAAIETLERIRWRKVEEEVPNYDIEGMEILQTKFSIRHPELRFISLNYYCPETENKWNNPKTVGTSHWAYPPELPEEDK